MKELYKNMQITPLTKFQASWNFLKGLFVYKLKSLLRIFFDKF